MMRVPLTIGLLTASCFLFGISAASSASDHDGSSGSGTAGASADRRPVLDVRQGRYFRASAPSGWSFHENTNGVDVAAPDGATGASASILVGGFAAQMTPQRYLQMVLHSLGHSPQSIVHWEPLPSRPAFLDFSWQLGRARMRFNYQGTPVEAEAIAGVVQGAGQY
jgi:hypothetical protein